MSDFFMWGGFIFCLIWHFVYLRTIWDNLTNVVVDPKDEGLVNLNAIISGIGLCYFGMLSFG